MVGQIAELASGPLAHELTHTGRFAEDHQHVAAGDIGGIAGRKIADRLDAEKVTPLDIEAGRERWMAARRNRPEARLLDDLILTKRAGSADRPEAEPDRPRIRLLARSTT